MNIIIKNKNLTQEIATQRYKTARSYLYKNIDTAKYLVDQIIQSSENTEKSILTANAYWLQGFIHYNNKDFSESMKSYLKAADLFEKLNEPNSHQVMLSNISDLAMQNGCKSIAIDYAEKQLELMEYLDDYNTKSNILYTLGLVYNRAEFHEKAINSLKEANAILTNEITINDSVAYADVLDETALAHIGLYRKNNLQSHLDSALIFLNSSFNLDHSEINRAKAFNNLGRVYMLKHEPSMAYEYLYKSLSIKKRINSSRLFISTYNNLGVLHYDNNQLDSAKYYFTASINENTKPKSVKENLRDDQLHIVFYQHDEVEKSLVYLDSISNIAPFKLTVNEVNLKEYQTKLLANDKLIIDSIIKDEIQEADRLALKKEQDRLKAANQRKVLLLALLILVLSSTVIWLLYRYIRNRIAWNKARKEIQQQIIDSGFQIGE